MSKNFEYYLEIIQNNITQTSEFLQWFGESKVVDNNNNPLIVYHGTNKDFVDFDHFKHGGKGIGKVSFFSSSIKVAKTFGNRIISAYLRIQNPARLGDVLDTVNLFELYERFNSTPGEQLLSKMGTDEPYERTDLYLWYLDFSEVFEDIKKAGFDGAIITEQDVDNFIVFSSDQIKIL